MLTNVPGGLRWSQRLEEGAEGAINDEDSNTVDDFNDTWLFVVP